MTNEERVDPRDDEAFYGALMNASSLIALELASRDVIEGDQLAE